jgi:hypothetical protein
MMNAETQRRRSRSSTTGLVYPHCRFILIAEVEAEIAGYTSRVERRGAVAVYEACVAVGQRQRGASRWE